MGTRGFALIETILSFSFLSGILTGFLFLFYYAVAFFWIRFHLQEALFCTAEKRPQCEFELQEQIHSFLPLGKLLQTQLVERKNEINGFVEFHLSEKLQIQEVQTLGLPWSGHE